jgi:magnesium transporter
MMRILLSRKDVELNRPVQVGELSRILADPSNLLWVDVGGPTADDTAVLRREFGFHELALEDALTPHERPKLDRYESYYLLVLYGATFNERKLTIDEYELDIFIGPNYIVTVHDAPVTEVDRCSQRWEQNAGRLDVSVGVLLYSLLDTLVDGYFPVLDAIAEQTEEIELRIFNAFDPGAQAQIFGLRKELLNFRRVLAPERDLLLMLSRRELPLLDERTEAYFQDVYDHVMRATDSVDLYRDLLSSALDSYLSLSSNNLNIVFRTMTSISIILMSLSLIAGIYGMNFNPEVSPLNMPELNNPYGYIITLTIMALVAGGLYMYFRRRRWL